MRKVLIVTYYWPPAGGPGVQRILKFVKFLPSFGWQPIILTVNNGQFPAIDSSLESNIPEEAIIYKTKSFEPMNFYKLFVGMKKDEKIPNAVLSEKDITWKKKVANWIRLNLFIPDAKIGWKFKAVKEGLKIIEKEKPDIIFSSSPPPTVHLVASKLAHKKKIKWVADFRDPWTDIHYYENQPKTKIANKIDETLEMNVLTKADKITCISKLDIEEDFSKKTQRSKCVNIPNGYDEEDFEKVNLEENISNTFVILHLGAVNNERNPQNLFKAIRQLADEKKIESSNFQYKFVGKVDDIIKNTVNKYSIERFVEFIDYLPHKESLKFMGEASLLTLLITNSEKNKRILPGKTFEYLRTGKMILTLGPEAGEVGGIITEFNAGEIIDYSNYEKIYSFLNNTLNAWKKDRIINANKNENIAKYSRKNLTGELVNVFENILK